MYIKLREETNEKASLSCAVVSQTHKLKKNDVSSLKKKI